MEKEQYGTIRIGQIVKLFTDSIGFDALLSSIPEHEKEKIKRRILRLEKEEDCKINGLREFEELLKGFCNWALKNNYIVQTQSFVIQSLYFDMLALITNTNPYNNPTRNEVELQVMYCIALIYRELYDELDRKDNSEPGTKLGIILSLFDFWKYTNYTKNISLIPSCFDFIFSEIKNPKKDLIEHWELLKDSLESAESERNTSYAKTINDWTEKNVIPTWKTLNVILSSPLPDNIEFKESKANYELFKRNLFMGYFFTNFFTSLEEQNLVSQDFKDTVQNGLRWFYWYLFINKGQFINYQETECRNPMFSLMRFMVLPIKDNRHLISEYIYKAFDKENGMDPDIESLYYIPINRINFPVRSSEDLAIDLEIYKVFFIVFNELSTDKDIGIYENKRITENDIDKLLNLPFIGECRNFYYNWFKGKYHVLCHDFETGLDFYKKAFDYRYFGGKALMYFLEEIIVLCKEFGKKKTEFNKIYEWASALRFCFEKIDGRQNRKIQLRDSFEDVFPETAFIR